MTPQMRILVATETVDGRMGIDRLAAICKHKLAEDPFSGCIFIFRTRSHASVKLLCFDGRGYWLAQKRLSQGRFRLWPDGPGPSLHLEAHQVQVLLAAGDPNVQAAPIWRSVSPMEVLKSTAQK